MTIVHKNTGESIHNFPHEYKMDGVYGHLIVLWDGIILFFYSEEDRTEYHNITNQFTLYRN